MSNALFLGNFEDKQYLPHLKGMFGGISTYVLTEPISLLSHLKIYCTKRSITKVVSTNTTILSKLLENLGTHISSPSLDNYAGSLFSYEGIEIVFVNPLKQLFTVSYGKFICERFISKLVSPSKWMEPTPFSFTVFDAPNAESIVQRLAQAYAISIDIETIKLHLQIRCVGYTGIYIDPISGKISTSTYVVPLDSEFNLSYIRKINGLPVQKIFQNGKYDVTYFLRYHAEPRDWYWDTAHFFHSWYSELPKDLAFLNAFFLRTVVYWKDLAKTTDLYEYYKYNAMDAWATANVWIQQLLQSPGWARHNYTLEFPLVYPCLLAEMTGIERDTERMIEARKEIDTQITTATARLRKILGAPAFNPGSWQQVRIVLELIGCKDITSTEEKDLNKAAYRHPLNGFIISLILETRGLRKLKSNYLRLDSDADKGKDNGAKEFNGRILYSINPHGTDTARCASREHHFWTGLQIQNIPRGPEVKQTIRASEGFYLAEADLEQAESRDTAHIAGDEALIKAVSGSRDFHSVNASAFFGIPYDSIFDDTTRKTLDKKLRDLSKRVNHGANYNMGILVLIDTMGIPAVWEAKRILRLPFSSLEEVAEYLLTVFHVTYQGLRGPIFIRNESVRIFLGLPKSTAKLYSPGTYYASVAYEIGVTNRLTSRAYHHTEFNLLHHEAREYIERGDWTRHCFGDPQHNKLDLNSYVAHPPQSLNARTLNEAFMKVFYEIALQHPTTFRFHAQIHDSILFSYKAGYESHCERVREYMEIPCTVRDVHGTYRTFTVPAALKLGKKDKVTGELVRAIYWSDTE